MTKAATADLPDMLDELTDGKGDGCIAVERTRLEGVADHVTIHANHVELVRGPLLYPDPGPVACMPVVLKWLKADRRQTKGSGPRQRSQRSRRRVLGFAAPSVNLVHAWERVAAGSQSKRIFPMSQTVVGTRDEAPAVGYQGRIATRPAFMSSSPPRCGSASATTECGRSWCFI